MKKLLTTFSFMLLMMAASAQILGDDDAPKKVVCEVGLKFCEGTTPYKNMLLVSNFGGSELNPLNTDGKGYIVSINSSGVSKRFIPADGNLSAPKGMVVVNNHLFIADVNKVVVYNLKELEIRPQIIKFPAEDIFVNDLAQMGDMILVSVTNTGRLYGIDASNPRIVGSKAPQLIGNVPGANGLVVADNMIYIASYNPDEKPNAHNVIYAYDMYAQKNPMKKLIANLAPGQYDGIALSPDGTTLFFTAWSHTAADGASIYSYKLDGKSGATKIGLGVEFKGPADISIKDDMLWIPDLPASKVYGFPLY